MTVHFRIGFNRWSLVVRFPGNQFIAELLAARKSFLNDDEGGVCGLDVFYLNLLALKLLVILDEAAQDEEAMVREVACLEILAEFGIVRGYGDDFVVPGAGIDHGHHADGACLDEAERLDRFLTKGRRHREDRCLPRKFGG